MLMTNINSRAFRPRCIPSFLHRLIFFAVFSVANCRVSVSSVMERAEGDHKGNLALSSRTRKMLIDNSVNARREALNDPLNCCRDTRELSEDLLSIPTGLGGATSSQPTNFPCSTSIVFFNLTRNLCNHTRVRRPSDVLTLMPSKKKNTHPDACKEK